MSGSVRIKFTMGIAALTASTIALAPTTVPPQRPDVGDVPAPAVALAAAVKPLIVAPMTPQQLDTARTAIGRLDPQAASLLLPPPPAPAPLNAASNSIASAYEWLQGWVSYGVELAQYALQFIPYGYLIGNQIGIVYDTLVLPISDSVVYGLIIPVVNDPLNLASYVNGAVAIASTTVNSIVNFGIAEFNYFFGWLIPPIPPIGLAATEPTTLSALKLAAEPTLADDAGVVAAHDETTTVDADAPTAVDTADVAGPVDTDVPTEAAQPAASETLPEPTETQAPAEATAATDEVTEAATAPGTPKPETESEQTPGTTTTTTTTTSTSNGTVDATNAKPDEDKKPGASKDTAKDNAKDTGSKDTGSKDTGSKDTGSKDNASKDTGSAGVQKTGKSPGKHTTKKDAEKANA